MTAPRPDVAVFIPTLETGGAERVALNLAQGFVESGRHVELVLGRRVGDLLDDVDPRVGVRDLDAWGGPALVPALARYLRSAAPSALLSHLDVANVAALLGREISRSRTKVVVCTHTPVTAQVEHAGRLQDRWVARGLRWLYPRADGVVAVSEGVAADLAAVARLPRSRVRVIHNPIVSQEMLANARKHVDHPWLADGNTPVLVAAGRLNAQKDYPTLLRGFRRARTERVLRLLILGEGEERTRLEQLARELELADDVQFRGVVGNPYPFIARASLLVLSSALEGFGNVLVEALACGTPVVSTDCPSGPAEILGGGRYGRLVPVGDANALGQAMLATLDDPPERNLLRARGRRFDTETAVERYRELLGI